MGKHYEKIYPMKRRKKVPLTDNQKVYKSYSLPLIETHIKIL